MRIKTILTNLAFALLGGVITLVLTQTTVSDPLIVPPEVPSIAVTNNEDAVARKSFFQFSPNEKHIAFIENVFDEYGNDYDCYYAVTVFDVTSQEESRIFIGTYKTSGFEWLDNDTVRVFLNAGTGVRAYRDVSAQRSDPIIVKDYMKSGEMHEFWTPDEVYMRDIKGVERAYQTYHER